MQQASDNPPDSIADRIIGLVARQSGRRPESIGTNDRLLHDLNLYGDDAEELLTRVATQFQVDMKGFEFHRHFFAEGYALWLIPSFIRRKVLAAKQPLTVQQLIKCAESRVWKYQ